MITYATNNSFQTSYLHSLKYQFERVNSKIEKYIEKDIYHTGGVKLFTFHPLSLDCDNNMDVLIA